MPDRAVLFFDTSSTAAGVLLEAARPESRIVALERFAFESSLGDQAVAALFAAATAWRERHPGGTLEVGCEAIYVSQSNPAARSIQEAINRRKGVLQLLARQAGLRWGGELSPGTGKLALTGRGNAGKERMVMTANARFGAQIMALTGKRLLFTGNAKTCGEHVADALGGGLAALAGRWQETPAEKRERAKAEKARLKASGLPVPKKAVKRTSVFEQHVKDYEKRKRAELAARERQGVMEI